MKLTHAQLRQLVNEALLNEGRFTQRGAAAHKLLKAVLQDPEHWDLADAVIYSSEQGDPDQMTVEELADLEDADIDWVLDKVRSKIVKGRADARGMMSDPD